MNTILITAFVLLLAQIGFRYHEIKIGEKNSFSIFLRKGDLYVEKFYSYLRKLWVSFRHFLSYTKHSVIEKTWDSITHSVHFTKKKVDTLHDKLNGKGEIKQTDHVSFYLQSVSDYKKSMRDNQN